MVNKCLLISHQNFPWYSFVLFPCTLSSVNMEKRPGPPLLRKLQFHCGQEGHLTSPVPQGTRYSKTMELEGHLFYLAHSILVTGSYLQYALGVSEACLSCQYAISSLCLCYVMFKLKLPIRTRTSILPTLPIPPEQPIALHPHHSSHGPRPTKSH